MLAKKFKIGSKTRIAHVLEKGLKIQDQFFQLRCLRNKLIYPRFSVVTSRKISKKAVERNFARRRVYEAIRSAIISLKPCYDIVVLLSRRTLTAKYCDIQVNVLNCLRKVTHLS